MLYNIIWKVLLYVKELPYPWSAKQLAFLFTKINFCRFAWAAIFCHMVVYIPIDAEASKEQNGAYCNFLRQTMVKIWLLLANSVSEKDEEVLLFLWRSLRMADLFDDAIILIEIEW